MATDVTPQDAPAPDPVQVAGVAPIKKEYLKPKNDPAKQNKRQYDQALLDEAEEQGAYQEENSEREAKRLKLENQPQELAADVLSIPTDESSKSKKRQRGQNKKRDRSAVWDEVKICNEVAQGKTCEKGKNCRWSHDIDAYLANKGEDLGPNCPQFDLFGQCKYGIKCRFAKAHTDNEGKMIVDKEKTASITEADVFKNAGLREFQKALRTRKIELKKADEYTTWYNAAKLRRQEINEGIDIPPGMQLRQSNGTSNGTSGENEGLNGDDGGLQIDVSRSETATDGLMDAIAELTKVPNKGDVPKQANKPKLKERFANTTIFDEKHREARRKILEKFDHDPATIRFRCDRKKPLDFRGKTYLAPLTTVGNLPFRRICKSFGVDITCGEMAMVTNLLSGQQHEWALTKRHVSEDIFGVQIAGNSVQTIARCCEAIKESGIEVDFVDLNLGCPVDSITKIGAGSALLDQKAKLYDICAGANYVLGDTPFTVKLRKGISTSKPVAHKLLPLFKQAGVSLVSLHGRSKEQRYTKQADWAYIKECSSAVNDLPLFGNGDILSPQDYWRQIEEEHLDGVMIGRGALIKPWIFTEIRERRVWDISSGERFDMLKDFAKCGLEYWGSDTMGVNTTRRFMCEWMSFLYRYIPVGLLEVLPQKINDRPPAYYGRNDLETMMASPNSKDWVKISEMILGPAPPSFNFVPKHKSNAYENDNYEG
ncbi:tRNA dihydrouridine synthase DUS3 [Spizellomyces punctatus DAOM BR117]|uniref:tRNA-dihydrouridine(47) synthase [NAD(P)(+)] n=1 Tax=Spizellomyces punctatus (strain DAOM BR117) TaxID=645134 RepID=A0A0L0HKF9_SPIPD|nr:tRNA dihydrouridine synthase DUS3 [Spizellomyces punctatus DAOM BR117]KND01319.1 hypothetical protein SPPG_03132 [Spizellomyces punctatus DAOM BR117]|eukprot:XP_016609358.1 hypothetical protein SPPG_03132 [Spizellomyces punctatus DAOM BR117]